MFGFSAVYARLESDNYVIWADVLGSGGAESGDSSNYSIQDTIGEAIAWSPTNTSDLYGIKAGFREMYLDQYLTFTSSTSSIDFGTLSTTEAKSASHTLTADTNATKGLTITVGGSTLTSGANTITAFGATAAPSSPGTEQFGINLKLNTSPAVGAEPSPNSGQYLAPAGQYATANSFAFQSGDTIASAGSDVNSTTLTVSYVANIAGSTEGGSYATTLTYSATANF